jgi:exosortase B
VIIWLIWNKRQILFDTVTRTAPLAGFGLLSTGLLTYVIGNSLDIAILEVASLAPIIAGVLLAMRGWPGLRALWFPVLFVAYLVPLPGMYLYAITGPLKQTISSIVEATLYAAGYPVAQTGVMIMIGQYELLVADACAGLNSMISLSAVGLLYLYLMRRQSWLHNALIFAGLLPIAFLANVVRVLALALITYHFGDAAGQGFLHGFSGLALFMFALAGILAFDAILSSTIARNTAALK